MNIMELFYIPHWTWQSCRLRSHAAAHPAWSHNPPHWFQRSWRSRPPPHPYQPPRIWPRSHRKSGRKHRAPPPPKTWFHSHDRTDRTPTARRSYSRSKQQPCSSSNPGTSVFWLAAMSALAPRKQISKWLNAFN